MDIHKKGDFFLAVKRFMSDFCYMYLYLFSLSTLQQSLGFSRNTIRKYQKPFDQKSFDLRSTAIFDWAEIEQFLKAFKSMKRENARISQRLKVEIEANKKPEKVGEAETIKLLYLSWGLLDTVYTMIEAIYPYIERAESICRSLLSYTLKDSNYYYRCSNLFLWRLNISFSAFCTLSVDDVFFIGFYHIGDKNERERLKSQLYSKLENTRNRVNCEIEQSRKWHNAEKHFRSQSTKHYTNSQLAKNLLNKIEKITSPNNLFTADFGIKLQDIIAQHYFLRLIWPKEGKADTDFSTEEFKILTLFKYSLTEEAKSDLVNQLLSERGIDKL